MADTITRITRAIREVPPPLGLAAAVVALDLAGRAALKTWGARRIRREVADEMCDWLKIREDRADARHIDLMDGIRDVLTAQEDARKVLEEIRDQEPEEAPRDWSPEDTVGAFRRLVRRDGLPHDVAARYVGEWRRAAQ